MSLQPKLNSPTTMKKETHAIEPKLASDAFDRSATAITSTKLRPTSPSFFPAGHKEIEEIHDKSQDEEKGTEMQGIVHNLKHAYGFVRCDTTGERIFFHYSEIDPKSVESLGPVPADHPPVIIGDHVRFRRVIDTPTGKLKAVKVEVVSRPARIIVEPKPELGTDHYSSPANDDYSAAIVTTHDPNAPRETGVVVSTKQNYGFIKCAERDHKQVFFHFTQLVEAAGGTTEDLSVDIIQPGMEVAFSLSASATGRVVATRVQILPPGSISFYSIESSVLYGFIKSGLESSHTSSQKTRRRARPSSNDNGSLVLPAKERSRVDLVSALPHGQDSVLSFTGVDLKFPGIKLFPGDQVGFRLKLDRRTQTLSSTDIFLLKCASTGRKHGILTMWKDVYGFLKMDGKKEQMFVHLNEFIEKAHSPAVGDELEFDIAPDNHGQDNAIRISILPKGTVQLYDDRLFGLIMEKPSMVYPVMPEGLRRARSEMIVPSSAHADTTEVYGIIRLLHKEFNPVTDASAKELVFAMPSKKKDKEDDGFVRFMMADFDCNTMAVRVGDIVSLAIAPAPKFKRAANIQLMPKIGSISDIADNQIVVKVEGNDFGADELFEFLCDDDGSLAQDLKVHDKVEIDQVEAGISPMAMRISRRLRPLKPSKAGKKHHHHVGASRNRKPLLKKSVSMDLSPASYRRWDLRLEPRNWS